jgi:UTP--glucose-1-phosphate uridylyltransferase
MRKPVRKAIFPVGGLGTRFLPATKAMPKEMLPVVDKPLIQYAVEEARAAGIEELIFVTGRGKSAIEDHFDYSYELMDTLKARGKKADLKVVESLLPTPGNITYTRQQEPRGLGHAVWCARHLIGVEPFAVLLADDLVQADVPCLKQMVEVYNKLGGNLVAVMDVPREHTDRYGILKTGGESRGVVEALGLVEKPKPDVAPSTLSIIGRYILQPEVMDHLSAQEPGAGGEIQLTDAIRALIDEQPVFGYRFEGERHDAGTRIGWLKANVAMTLQSEDADEFRAYVRGLDLRD